MSVSCALLPDFRDETLAVFPLRLLDNDNENDNDSSGNSAAAETKWQPRQFAIPGAFCDCGFSCARKATPTKRSVPETETETESIPRRLPSEDRYQDRRSRTLWSFLLTPLTRWDAARFLRLAHEPTIRKPQVRYAVEEDRSLKLFRAPQNDVTIPFEASCPNREAIVQESEQAHPFLPLFPFMVQCVAKLLLWIVPRSLLPPTCDSVLTASSWILNTLCFVWAASELYFMTRLLLLHHLAETTVSGSSKASPSSRSRVGPDLWAKRVMLLFLINPATVFFGVAYSEAIGSALVFTGCRLFLQHNVANSPSDDRKSRLFSNLLLCGATLALWLACWVRSNASLYAGLFFLYGVGKSLNYQTKWMQRALAPISGVFLSLSSIVWHNYNAFILHCHVLMGAVESSNRGACHFAAYEPPDWCQNGPFFNIYSYVQHKYWNVGFLRYYKWKQIPNFILAAPVLLMSAWAVSTWIVRSWRRLPHNSRRPWSIVSWAILSLQDFANAKTTSSKGEPDTATPESVLVGSPIVLGHYAVLVASALLCLTLAHVQISTRVIFSTCPALYWFLVTKICSHDKWGNAILVWCLLYTFLGIVMHPNWLPWT